MMRYEDFLAEAALSELAIHRIERRSSQEVRHVYDVVRAGAAQYGKSTQVVHADFSRVLQSLGTSVRGRLRMLPRTLLAKTLRLRGDIWSAMVGDRMIRHYERDDQLLLEPPRVTPLVGVLPKASIIVLSWNRREYLARTLRYFQRTIDYPAHELIVVDNGSSDGSVELLRRAVAEGVVTRLILSPVNLGVARGYNLGFAHADPASEYWVKLDSDILVLAPGWLHEFVRIFRADERVGLLALNQLSHPILSALPAETRYGARLINWSYWCAGASCMTVPRRTFERLGYFCEGYDGLYTPDEGDYYQRMARLGLEGYYVADLRAYHQVGLDAKSYGAALKRRLEVELPKFRASFAPMLASYDRGDWPLHCRYSKYAQVSMERVVELDPGHASELAASPT